MNAEPESTNQNGRSWLENKIASLDALYRKYGRDGLKQQSLSDIGLLLSHKELTLREAPKGRDIGEGQKETNRLLELEIKDIGGFINAQLTEASLPRRTYQGFQRSADQPRQMPKPKQRDRDYEMG